MSKSRSLHALLFSPFSPFRDEIAKGLQLNLAYLIAFSCMNDLIGWICEVETDERTGDKAYYMTGKDGRKRVDPKGEGSKNNPTDRQIARGVLRQLDLAFADKRFISLNTRRNKLPLTHGKVEDKSSSWAQVEDQHISDLVEILVDLSIEWESRIAD